MGSTPTPGTISNRAFQPIFQPFTFRFLELVVLNFCAQFWERRICFGGPGNLLCRSGILLSNALLDTERAIGFALLMNRVHARALVRVTGFAFVLLGIGLFAGI